MILSAKLVQYPTKVEKKQKKIRMQIIMFLFVLNCLAFVGIHTAMNLSTETSTTHQEDIICKTKADSFYKATQ